MTDTQLGIMTIEATQDCESCGQDGMLRVVMWDDVELQRAYLCDKCVPSLEEQYEATAEVVHSLVSLGLSSDDAIVRVKQMVIRPLD